MLAVISDARDAVRMVVRNIGLTVTQLCVFAITIGATTAAFTVVDGVFLTPVPFPEAHSLIHVWNGFERSRTDVVNVNSFKALRDANRSMAAMSAYLEVPMAEFSGPTEEHIVARVSASFFDEVLRVDPLLGRTFTRSDELPDSEPVAIISHEFWVSRFSSDPAVLGRRVLLQDYPSLAIVGVLPPGFRSPRTLEEPASIWTLAGSGPPIIPRMLFKIFGRLRPNVSLEQARAELETIQDAVAREGGEAMLGHQLRIGPIEELYGRPETRTAILLVFGAVLAVQLIGLANLVAVELARLPEYEGDLALRAALGAPPLRLARLMVVKSLIVSLAGGVGGTLLAAASHGILLANLPSAVPRVLDIGIDGCGSCCSRSRSLL